MLHWEDASSMKRNFWTRRRCLDTTWRNTIGRRNFSLDMFCAKQTRKCFWIFKAVLCLTKETCVSMHVLHSTARNTTILELTTSGIMSKDMSADDRRSFPNSGSSGPGMGMSTPCAIIPLRKTKTNVKTNLITFAAHFQLRAGKVQV